MENPYDKSDMGKSHPKQPEISPEEYTKQMEFVNQRRKDLRDQGDADMHNNWLFKNEEEGTAWLDAKFKESGIM